MAEKMMDRARVVKVRLDKTKIIQVVRITLTSLAIGCIVGLVFIKLIK